MSEILMRLNSQGRQRLIPETYNEFVNTLPGGLEHYVEPLHREVALSELKLVIGEAMNRFQPGEPTSDSWLAPRVHATLRLTRREAAGEGIWDYLSGVVLQDYVRWRWGDAEGRIPTNRADRIRITSRNRAIRHAVWRLWWIAELSRNGPDYSPTVQAFTKQETVEWFVIRALRNRAAAQAFLKFLGSLRDGEWAIDKQIRRLAKALDHTLTTVVLDAFAPDPGPNLQAVQAWINEKPDATMMFNALPRGPEDPIPEDQVNAALYLLEHLWCKIKFEDQPENIEAADESRAAEPA